MLPLLATLSFCSAEVDLKSLEAEIQKGTFPKITSILIDRGQKIVYEKYFGEGSPTLLNDSRSVTKTVTSLAAGIAGTKLKTAIENTPVAKTFGVKAASPDWAGVTLKDLLTMSSPLAADDSDQDSPGCEDRMHEQSKWLDWGLKLPTKTGVSRDKTGHFPFCYATINAVLAGQVIQKLTGQKFDKFVETSLLRPMQITKSKFQYSKSGEVMSGGGLRLTSRDLTKLGRLILDKGRYAGRQVVPAKWIAEMTTPHRRDTIMPGVDYGYFLWKITFGENSESNTAWCMLGNGGNIVAVFPQRNTVITITRTDYNSGTTAPETMKIIGALILPNLK